MYIDIPIVNDILNIDIDIKDVYIYIPTIYLIRSLRFIKIHQLYVNHWWPFQYYPNVCQMAGGINIQRF